MHKSFLMYFILILSSCTNETNNDRIIFTNGNDSTIFDHSSKPLNFTFKRHFKNGKISGVEKFENLKQVYLEYYYEDGKRKAEGMVSGFDTVYSVNKNNEIEGYEVSIRGNIVFYYPTGHIQMKMMENSDSTISLFYDENGNLNRRKNVFKGSSKIKN